MTMNQYLTICSISYTFNSHLNLILLRHGADTILTPVVYACTILFVKFLLFYYTKKNALDSYKMLAPLISLWEMFRIFVRAAMFFKGFTYQKDVKRCVPVSNSKFGTLGQRKCTGNFLQQLKIFSQAL